MTKPSVDLKQIRHDLRGLIEPLETVKMLLEVGKVEQATRIQSALLETLKKIVRDVETTAENPGGES